MPAATDPEIVTDIPSGVKSVNSQPVMTQRGPCRFNLATTLQSPFFWLSVGIIGTIVYQHWNKGKNKSSGMFG